MARDTWMGQQQQGQRWRPSQRRPRGRYEPEQTQPQPPPQQREWNFSPPLWWTPGEEQSLELPEYGPTVPVPYEPGVSGADPFYHLPYNRNLAMPGTSWAPPMGWPERQKFGIQPTINRPRDIIPSERFSRESDWWLPYRPSQEDLSPRGKERFWITDPGLTDLAYERQRVLDLAIDRNAVLRFPYVGTYGSQWLEDPYNRGYKRWFVDRPDWNEMYYGGWGAPDTFGGADFMRRLKRQQWLDHIPYMQERIRGRGSHRAV